MAYNYELLLRLPLPETGLSFPPSIRFYSNRKKHTNSILNWYANLYATICFSRKTERLNFSTRPHTVLCCCIDFFFI